MIADLEAVRNEIDRLTPDLRDTMPTTATEYGNRLFAAYLTGMGALLRLDALPWVELAGNESLRHRVADGLMADALHINGDKL